MISRGVRSTAACASCQPGVGQDQSSWCLSHLTNLPRREQRLSQGQAYPFYSLNFLLSLLFTLLSVDSSLWSSWVRSREQIVPMVRPGCSGTCTSPGALPSPLQVLNLHQEYQPLQLSVFSHFSEVTWEGTEVKCLKLSVSVKAINVF